LANRDITNPEVLASYGMTFKYSTVRKLDLTQLTEFELSELNRFCLEESPRGYVIMMIRIRHEQSDRRRNTIDGKDIRGI